MNLTSFAVAVGNRLTHGHERHGQRWHLHLPRDGEPAAEVRPLLVVLGLPTFGLALAISAVTTFGPVILLQLTHSTTAVGALVGGEGAFALVVPLVAGAMSDRLPPSPLGRRLPFVLAGAPLAAFGLVLLPFSWSVGVAAAAVLTFFVGYYVYYPPYRALYADLLPRSLYARAQAGQAIARGAGLGLALLIGGLLLGLWQPLPFLVAAVVLGGTTLALLPVFRLQRRCHDSTLPYELSSLRVILRDSNLGLFGGRQRALGVQLRRTEELHCALCCSRSRALAGRRVGGHRSRRARLRRRRRRARGPTPCPPGRRPRAVGMRQSVRQSAKNPRPLTDVDVLAQTVRL
jgi:Major Facilitator Superfamily